MNYFKITRFQNNLITFASVILGGLSGEVASWSKLVIAAFSASFISAGGYSLNDYFDLEIDRINRPKRVLPKGDISPKHPECSSARVMKLLSVFGVHTHGARTCPYETTAESLPCRSCGKDAPTPCSVGR